MLLVVEAAGPIAAELEPPPGPVTGASIDGQAMAIEMPVLFVIGTATAARWAPDPVALSRPPPRGHARLLIVAEDEVVFEHYPLRVVH